MMLLEKIARAEIIVADQCRTKSQKDKELVEIMNQMELQYGIPSAQESEWGIAHPDIIAAYRYIRNLCLISTRE